MPAIARKENFTQVVVWPGTTVSADEIERFEAYMLEEFNTRVQYLECIETTADFDDPTTGGRIDTVFAIHQDDIGPFAVHRFTCGMRWIEDVLDNERRINTEAGHPFHTIYPNHLQEYRTW